MGVPSAGKSGFMGSRGENKNTYALWEELKYLRVAPEVEPVSIHKRLDTEK